jgi:hypothetical protein
MFRQAEQQCHSEPDRRRETRRVMDRFKTKRLRWAATPLPDDASAHADDAAEISSDPAHPNRLEKKTNT